MGGKWVELLKEIAPGVERVLFIHHPDTVTKGYEAYLKSVSNAAPTFAIKVEEAFVRDENATEQAMSDFARQGNGGLIFPPDPFTVTHRNKIAALAQRLRLPAIYPFKTFVDSGGLASYGVDRREQDEKVAGFVNRILQGASPADIPAEGPTKFELAINLRAAKAMGLSVPPTLLARADVVIE
jgi:putative ABC transport system substrate-binding protein